MNQVWGSKVPLYFETEESQLVLGDSFKILTKMKPESVDMIFADPPYFLSNDGITCQGGKMVSVNKGSWDKLSESGTSVEEKHKFNRKWIRLCKRVLKPNGTIWISGTLHNIYSIGMALEQEGFKIINNITWQKTNPPPNLACRCFTHSTETILWARKNEKKSRHFFNYQKMKEMNGGKQMKDVWTGSLTKPSEKTEGKPDVLILDDSASALDFATDAALRKAIRGMNNSPTVFIVSQRAASLMYADLIIVLDDGQVAGMGTHDELLANCEVYKEIYESQFKKADSEGGVA